MKDYRDYVVEGFESVVEYIDSSYTPLEQRVINWVLSHRMEYDALVDRGVFSGDIVAYCVANDCEDMPIEWVVPLVYKESK